jgi:hypothetical protein
MAARISSGKLKKVSTFEIELQQAFEYLAQYGDAIPQAATAVLLFKILERLSSFSENSNDLKSIALIVVNQIISTEWFDWRDIKVFQLNICNLFSFY